MNDVALPAGLQSLKFDLFYNQSIEHVAFPAGLQSLTIGRNYKQSIGKMGQPAFEILYL